MTIRVIFNADDYNLTPGVTRGILKAHGDGVVRSASFMVNLPHVEESAELLKTHPDLNIGLHVNLTFGRPVTDPVEVASLIDDDGVFWRKPGMLMEFARMEHIRCEITAQLKLAQKIGLKLTHLDSHHHVHQFEPGIHQILVDMAREEGLAVRSVDEDMKKVCQKAGVPTCDSFCGEFYAGGVSLECLDGVFSRLSEGFHEVMCHPGEHDSLLSSASSYNESRAREVNLLTSGDLVQLMKKYNIVPAGWGDLSRINT